MTEAAEKNGCALGELKSTGACGGSVNKETKEETARTFFGESAGEDGASTSRGGASVGREFDTADKVEAEFERKKGLRTQGVRIHLKGRKKGTQNNLEKKERKQRKKGIGFEEELFKPSRKVKNAADDETDEILDDSEINEDEAYSGSEDVEKLVETSAAEKGDAGKELPSGCSAFFSGLSKYPLLSPDEEKTLARKVRSGDTEAFEKFVLSNARLAISCVRDVSRRMGGNTILDFMDLAQEAMLGLMTAVERFDPERGVKFSTYGMYWIYQRVKRALVSQRKGLTVPGFAGESVFTLGDYIALYCEGREDLVPTRNLSRVKDLARLVGRMACFGDADEKEESGSDIVDEETLPSGDDASTPGGDDSMSIFLRDDFSSLLNGLTTRTEGDMLRRKFGLSPYNSPESYKEIGLVHGKSSETVRSMVEAVLSRLRRSRKVERFAADWLK